MQPGCHSARGPVTSKIVSLDLVHQERKKDVPGRRRKCPVEADAGIFRSRLKAQEEVVGIVLPAGVQDVTGGNLQGVVLGACHWAAGAHLVAAGGPAPPCRVLLKRSSYSAAASLRINSEGLDIAFQERFVIVQHRGPALLGADHLDQVAQEADAPGAVKGGEHVRFQRMRDAGSQIAVLSKNPGRQDEHLLEVCCLRLDL